MIANLRDLPYGWQLLLVACLVAAVCSGALCVWVAVRDHLERRWERQAEARAECNAATVAHIAATDPEFRWLDPKNAMAEAIFHAQLDSDDETREVLAAWAKDGAR